MKATPERVTQLVSWGKTSTSTSTVSAVKATNGACLQHRQRLIIIWMLKNTQIPMTVLFCFNRRQWSNEPPTMAQLIKKHLMNAFYPKATYLWWSPLFGWLILIIRVILLIAGWGIAFAWCVTVILRHRAQGNMNSPDGITWYGSVIRREVAVEWNIWNKSNK